MRNKYICHWGIKGMRWGVRRFQNPDGTLTPAGKKRYSRSTSNGETERDKPSMAQKAKDKIKSKVTKENCAKAAVKGAEVVSKLAMASMVDDVFYGGAGKKIAKETVKQTGRAAVTAYTMARGGYDIRWYDN